MFRLLRRILLATTAFIALAMLALVIIAYAYQDEVKARLIAELNAHLKVPVQQEGMDLTLIERFPQASLRMHNVLVREVRTDSLPADTLLHARDLYLELSLLAMLAGDYTVTEIHGKGVVVQPGLDKNGAENWLIWRSDSTSSGGTDIKLSKVTLDGFTSRFRDARTGLDVTAHGDKLALNGRIRDAGSNLKAVGDLWLDAWRDDSGLKLRERGAEVNLLMAFGGKELFRIEKGSELYPMKAEGESGEDPVAIDLVLTNGEAGHTIDLRASSFNMELSTLCALLPESLHRQLGRYAIGGEGDMAVHFTGPLDKEGPALSAGLMVRDGRFKERNTGAVFNDVHGELALDLSPRWVLSKLLVKGFRATAASGTIAGDIDLSGVTNAKLKADVRADIALADLMRFAQVDTLEEVQGRLKADAHVTGKLRDIANIKAADLRALAISGNAELRDATLKLKGVRHTLSDLNAALAVKGNDAQVDGLRCNVQGNPIELSGTLRNLMPYLLFPDQRLVIDARGSSPRLDLATLFASDATPETPADGRTAYAVEFPAHIDLDLRTTLDELVFEDFSAQKIVGTIMLKDRVLEISPISFNSAQGAVRGSLRLDGRGEHTYPLSIAADVDHIDITRLFAEFRDFGQGFITSRHLQGNGDVRLTLTAQVTPALKLDQSTLHCVAGIAIENGQLNDHAPMIAVADYLRTNKLVSPFVDTEELKKRLTHVTFARLENQIEIKDRTVHVPRMLVQSSAMDIEVSGSQTFDGGVDDHLNFRLADLFRTNSGADEFGPVVDDGTGMRIFLHMYGTTSDLKFKNDGAAASARRKDRIKQESEELKGILADIWHGNGGMAPDPVNRPIITVEGTGPEKNDANGTNPTAKPPKKKGLGKLLEKADKEEDEEIIILE